MNCFASCIWTPDGPLGVDAQRARGGGGPGLRDQSYAQYQAYVPEQIRTLRSTPGSVLGYEMSSVLHPGDWRYDTHAVTRAPEIKWADVTSVFRDSLKDTPVTVTITGDIDEAAAVAAVASTFATLPPRPQTVTFAPGSEATGFPPQQKEFVFAHDGRADQNISLVLWPTGDFYSNVADSRGLYLLAGVVQNRLFDALRQKAGADYSPQAVSNMDMDFPGYGTFQIVATIKAGDDAAFRAAVTAIIADLKTHPPSRDEVERVRAPILQSNAKARLTNDYWQGLMIDLAADPRARRSYLDLDAQLKAVDGKRLSELARTWLKDGAEIHVTVRPVEGK